MPSPGRSQFFVLTQHHRIEDGSKTKCWSREKDNSTGTEANEVPVYLKAFTLDDVEVECEKFEYDPVSSEVFGKRGIFLIIFKINFPGFSND